MYLLNIKQFIISLFLNIIKRYFLFLILFYSYRQLNLPQIQKILQEFEKQSEIMDMKEEIMNDAIDDAMEDEGDEEERYQKNFNIHKYSLYQLYNIHKYSLCHTKKLFNIYQLIIG